jgi:hypothetical protein
MICRYRRVHRKSDLIISVDTSVVSGRLNGEKPVWTLIPFVPDRVWLQPRGSPWYPTTDYSASLKLGDNRRQISRIVEELESITQMAMTLNLFISTLLLTSRWRDLWEGVLSGKLSFIPISVIIYTQSMKPTQVPKGYVIAR